MPWGDLPEATLESGDAVEAIRRITSEFDGTIVLWDSLTLSDAGLVELEYALGTVSVQAP